MGVRRASSHCSWPCCCSFKPSASGVSSRNGPRPVTRGPLAGHVDNLDLEAVGEVAASLNRYEFLLTAAPLPTRGTGFPINPIATF